MQVQWWWSMILMRQPSLRFSTCTRGLHGCVSVCVFPVYMLLMIFFVTNWVQCNIKVLKVQTSASVVSIVVSSLQVHYANYWAGIACGIVVTCTCKPGKRMCINRRDCKTPKRRQSFFCETLPVFPMSSLSVLGGELVKNIYCVFCQRKISSLARVSK